MATSDPLAPVISAISVLAAPQPTLNTASPQPPSAWLGGSSSALDTTLFVPVQVILGVLFGASGDLTAVGNGINTALSGVAGAVSSVATELGSLAAIEGEVQTVFSTLQTVLGLAQTLSPTATSGALQSAGRLFQQLQGVLAAAGSLPVAAAELAELSQQLTATAELFPSA
jgi:hypothetical protein